MKKKTYSELLKDPRWQKKRLQIMERDRWMCVACESEDRTLHVHHKRYEWGKAPWEYEEDDLQTLCDMCHEATTDASKALKAAIVHLSFSGELSRVAGYAVGQRVSRWCVPGQEPAPWLNDTVRLVDYEMAIGMATAICECFAVTADEIVAIVKSSTRSLDLAALSRIIKDKP